MYNNYFTLPNQIFDEDLTASEFVDYSYLVKCSDKSYWCFPSRRTIARQCNISVNTVDMALNSLIDKGLIEKTSRFSFQKNSSCCQTSIRWTECRPALVTDSDTNNWNADFCKWHQWRLKYGGVNKVFSPFFVTLSTLFGRVDKKAGKLPKATKQAGIYGIQRCVTNIKIFYNKGNTGKFYGIQYGILYTKTNFNTMTKIGRAERMNICYIQTK